MKTSVVTISPDIQSGTPVFSGTRVPIKNLFEYLRAGDTIEEFLKDFPSVTRIQIEQLLRMAESVFTFNIDDEENPSRRKSA